MLHVVRKKCEKRKVNCAHPPNVAPPLVHVLSERGIKNNPKKAKVIRSKPTVSHSCDGTSSGYKSQTKKKHNFRNDSSRSQYLITKHSAPGTIICT